MACFTLHLHMFFEVDTCLPLYKHNLGWYVLYMVCAQYKNRSFLGLNIVTPSEDNNDTMIINVPP